MTTAVAVAEVVKGHTKKIETFQTAVRDRHMQVRFSLKIVLKS